MAINAGTLDGALIFNSLGQVLLVSAAGIVAVSAVYSATLGALQLFRRPGEPSQPRPRLAWSTEPRYLRQSWSRGVALFVVALGLAGLASIVNDEVVSFVQRWDPTEDAQRVRNFAVMACVVWVGFLPLALFVSHLPHLTMRFGRRARGVRQRAGLASVDRTSREWDVRTDDLDANRPHTRQVRDACRRYAWKSALRAPDAPVEESVVSRSLPAALVLPVLFAIFLVATVDIWLVLIVTATLVAWVGLNFLETYRTALAAPGSAVTDYLLLATGLPELESNRARILLQRPLDPNPATLQDHEQLIARLASALWVGSVPWSIDSVNGETVEITTRLTVRERERGIHDVLLHFQLRRQRRGDWLVNRIMILDTELRRTHPPAQPFVLASAW